MSLGNLLTALQRRVARLGHRVQRQQPFDRTSHYADPGQSGAGLKTDFANSIITVSYGRITEIVPYLGWYRVQPENAAEPVACCSLDRTGGAFAAGVRGPSGWVVGDPVYFLRHPANPYGVIIGAEPPAAWSNDQSVADYITQAGRCGFTVDAAHYHLAGFNDFTFREFLSGAPLDSLSAGEVGQFSPTGPAWFIDACMAFLRADENCGLWLFALDQLARLHGHNLQIRSALAETEHLDDEDELGLVRAVSVYKHEALGLFTPLAESYRTFSAEELIETPHYGHKEPLFDDQVPFRRLVEYGGYLGQGSRRHVVIPPAGAGGALRTSQRPIAQVAQGAFQEHVSLDGSYVLQSAKSVCLSKRTLFPAPLRVTDPADNTGDTVETYRPAGQGDNGPAHRVQGSPNVPETGGFSQAARSLDSEAYGFVWKPDIAFHYHERDYYLPDRPVQESVPSYGTLASRQFLPPPASEEWQVDARYGTKYYAVNSAIWLYEDGSVSIRSGCGSEIRLANGVIRLSPAADLEIIAGRSAVVMAGQDVILRAHGAVEASANTGAVRLKAETDFQILAANSGSGSLVLESRSNGGLDVSGFQNGPGELATPTGGILIKAAESGVALWGPDVYISSLAPDGNGQLTLDAGQGSVDLVVNARNVLRYVRNQDFTFVGDPEAVSATYVQTTNGMQIGGDVRVAGDMIVTEGVNFGGDLKVVNGDIFAVTPLVIPLDDNSAELIKQVIDGVLATDQANDEGGTSLFLSEITTPYYDDGRPGSVEAIAQVSFGFRSSDSYVSEDWRLYETAWQQVARSSGQSLSSWTENPVMAGSAPTYPYPGLVAWTATSSLVETDPLLWESGPVGRSTGAYESPVLPSERAIVPDGHFTITG